MSEKNQVAIIDYGMGNLFNVQCACARVGLQSVITSDKKVIQQSRGLILPGVGAFGDAMHNLKNLDLIGAMKDHIGLNKPFLGICLGMQLLMTQSEEFGGHQGLNIIPGQVVRFQNRAQDRIIKVPQVGWNRIYFEKTPLFESLANGEYMYFVHSFYAVPEENGTILSRTRYEDTGYCSSLCKGQVLAVQFHPEKSGMAGLKIYKNWAQKVGVCQESIQL